MLDTENRIADTKPNNTNQNHGKIQKPNQPKNMREYQLLTEFTASYTLVMIANTNKIPKTLGLKYQIPSWYRFGIGIPKSWYPIDIF